MTQPMKSFLYRSQMLRWMFCLSGIAAAYGVGAPNPHWHRTPSLRLIAHLGLPWPVFSALFLAYAALLAAPRIDFREAGYWLGLFLYGVFVISIGVTVRFDRIENWAVLALAVDGWAAHYQSARIANFDRGRG